MKQKLFLLLGFCVLPFLACASESIEMADVMRSNGKIYVVVSVIAIIFAGIVLFLMYLDRKLSRMEKELKKRKEQK